jgi:hypothetical protein
MRSQQTLSRTIAALKARTEQDEEEDDDSTAVVPWTLSQATIRCEVSFQSGMHQAFYTVVKQK